MIRNSYTLQDYIQNYPKFKKWINECRLCHRVGYSPDMPEHIGSEYSYASRAIKKLGNPLPLNEDGLCEVCEKLIK